MRYSMLNWDILEDIDVSGNPWQCDCRLQWLFRMHLPRKVKDTIRCHFPQKLQGRSVSSLKEQDFVCGLELRVDLIIIFGLMTFVLFVVTFASCSYVLYKRNFCLKPRSHMQQQYTRIKSNKHSVDLEWDYSADP
ncbi:uncharacterized protein LOC143237907 [Tachypleus tridentatus]|uniref:uncharacterized protein LOC143237907 n=1 Tax=Tachypleus tridentatus TaxID=6853 RepID=UPI003FD382B8